jgi:predicted lipid-binding transport protein (Tim44 family)
MLMVGLLLPFVLHSRNQRKARTAPAGAAPATTTQRRRRDETVSLASAEATEDDPAFAADAVKTQAVTLYRGIQRAWGDHDDAALERMLGPDLLVEWRRRLADFARKGWVNEVAIRSGPQVSYVGLANREGTAEDRVTVIVSATLRSVVRTSAGKILTHAQDADGDGEFAVCEYWTLGRFGDRWRLISIEQEREGAHHLDAPVVVAPWSDDARLAQEAVVEVADADAPPPGTNVSKLVSVHFDGTARQHALDLALADPRCAPDVLEVAARRAVEAWAEAVDGDDDALLAIADREAADALLYPADQPNARVVVRGPVLLHLAITALRVDCAPPRMEVQARLRGRRYVEDRDTAALLAGDRDHARLFTERWTFELDESTKIPWRLVANNEIRR